LGCVEVPKPPPWEPLRRERWLLVLESLCGGLNDDGMLRWLSRFDTLDEAAEEAVRLRSGQIAT
jgi:hypothetical protein